MSRIEFCGKPIPDSKCSSPPGHGGLCWTSSESSMLAKIEDLLADRVSLRAEVAGLRERLADDRVTCGACLDPGNPSAPHDVTDCGCIYAPRGHVLADRLRARLAEVLEAGERVMELLEVYGEGSPDELAAVAAWRRAARRGTP